VDEIARMRLSEDFLKKLGGALRGAQLYSPSHPLVQRSFDALNESLTQLLADQPSIAIGVIGNEIVVHDGGNDPAPEKSRHRAHRVRARRDAGAGANAGVDDRAPGAQAGPVRTGRGPG
jgi:hypothetical protein